MFLNQGDAKQTTLKQKILVQISLQNKVLLIRLQIAELYG